MDEAAERAARAYGAAADHYHLPTLSFWNRFGADTVARLRLGAGMQVLDLCCGAGGSAIPAARAVGPAGRVLGIDVAEPLLELARAKASSEALANVQFQRADAVRTGLPSASFDVVVCVFGVFFVPDMAAFVAEMWRMVRPGGVLAITTWGPGLFEPANSLFWASVGEVEPALVRAFHPWDKVTTPQALREVFAEGGVAGAVADAVPGQHELAQPDAFWDVVRGSGYRATIDALTGEQRASVRETLLRALRANRVTSLRTDVVYGTARAAVGTHRQL